MKTLLNDGWFFAKLPCGSTLRDAENAGFEPVDLPHDWLIGQNDLYESADAWYTRGIELPEDHEPVVLVRFDGVYMDCDVLLNGETICTHPYGYTAFDAPLTGKLKKGTNQLTVHIRHLSPNSRWYSGSGIYRDVTLMTLPEDHIIPDSLYTVEREAGGDWEVRVSFETAGQKGLPFSCALYDREGGLAAVAEGRCAGNRGEIKLAVPAGKAWSPEEPYLYRLELCCGEQTESRRIGLRTLRADPDRGLFLNGQNIKLKGVCLHHDLGALGAAFHEKAARRQLRLMQEMGANAVRTSHNPPASAFLDLCDEMGILVVDEAFDMWEKPKTEYDYARFFPEWYKRDVASWIRRDRCHPCVIMWSIGNEIYDVHAGPRGAEVTKMLFDEVRRHDPDGRAYVTFGCNYMPWAGGQRCAELLDTVGYNYGEKLYDAHHAAHPEWVIYGSETASVLSSRGIYHFPIEQSIMSDADQQCSALGNSNTSWGADSLAKILIEDEQNRCSMGQFIWSGIDYIGEPTPYHTRSCYFGQADTACFPKDPYYLFQSFWTDRKMIHIGVSWDWNPGQKIDVPVITNCAAAELYLNGASLGRKRVIREDPGACTPCWKVPFSPGELRAVGYDDSGNPICRDSRFTPGETEKLLLDASDPELLSDGRDLVFVTVKAADANGRPVENARDRVKIEVSGGGRLIGADNGDSTDPDSYQSDCRRLFSGKLLLIIASNGRHEDVRVRVSGRNGPEAEMTIPVRRVPMKNGVSGALESRRVSMPETVHGRKILIEPLGNPSLTPENPACGFRYTVLPRTATGGEIRWQVTNAAGIESPFIMAEEDGDTVTVRARGDGDYYLRGLYYEGGQCAFISQTEVSAAGFGSPAMDPYAYISAGLYDLHEGDIGSGNEKGIAFARDGESMVGFSCVDFGKTGSDRLTADIFALNGDCYEIELWTAAQGEDLKKTATLRYQKPSIWNVYQAETWQLPVRLTGVQTLCFRMREKVHLKGFAFEKQSGAFLRHTAGSADIVYGDSFERNGESIRKIGNNVTLSWTEMDFDRAGGTEVEITGGTKLPANTIHLRIKNESGEETVTACEFAGTGESTQRFPVTVPAGRCTVSFVFLPGSRFDFDSFRFLSAFGGPETGQNEENKIK